MPQITIAAKRNNGRSIFKKLLISLLVILLVILVAAAALYVYLIAAKTTADDVAAITSAETMPASERYSFDPASLKMELNMDKSDLWWLLQQCNYQDTIADLSDTLKRNGFTLQSYGLDITGKGIFISAEITYGNSLRLPLRMSTETSFQDGTLTIAPEGFYLGNIRLPLDKFPLNRLVAGFGIDSKNLKDYSTRISLFGWDLMSTLTDVHFTDNRMVFATKLDESMLSGALRAYKNELDWYAGECTDSLEVLREYKKNNALGERFTRLVEGFAAKPGSFPGFITENLAVSIETDYKAYLTKNQLWLARFMPDITEKGVSDLHTALYKHREERSALFDKLLESFRTSYNSLRFSIGESGLLYKGKAFDLQSYLGEDWEKYSSWLDAASFRPVLIDNRTAEAAKTPLLKKITKSKDFVDNVPSLNKKYPIGFIVKMKDGTPVLKYFNVAIVGKSDSSVTINQGIVLDPADYEAMMKNPLMPVWRNGAL